MHVARGLGSARLTPEALAFIESARWVGNVRELEAVLEEAVILRADGRVTREDLNTMFVRALTMTTRPDRAVVASATLSIPALTAVQREALSLAAQRQELRRSDLMARCGLSREAARRGWPGW